MLHTACIYLVKNKTSDIREMIEICPKLIKKTTKQRQRQMFQCFYFKLWKYFSPCSFIFVVDFKHIIVRWDIYTKRKSYQFPFNNRKMLLGEFRKFNLMEKSMLHILHLKYTNFEVCRITVMNLTDRHIIS